MIIGKGGGKGIGNIKWRDRVLEIMKDRDYRSGIILRTRRENRTTYRNHISNTRVMNNAGSCKDEYNIER